MIWRKILTSPVLMILSFLCSTAAFGTKSTSLHKFVSKVCTTALLSSALFSGSPFVRAMSTFDDPVDPQYPGTAVARMTAIRERVKSLSEAELSKDWEEVRRKILWAGGLKDLPDAMPGRGYTGHSFNDFNHCDLIAMRGDEAHNENEGRVAGIAYRNPLGDGIKIASLPELGPGGSWSTCMIGSHKEPPQDVAHIQFRSRIAFKLVWVPPDYNTFVIVDDDGKLLAKGSPTGDLPARMERARNYAVVEGSKYGAEALNIAEAGMKSL